jgi:hypothetical protein
VVDGLCKELNYVPEILSGDLKKGRKPKASETAAKPQVVTAAEKKAAPKPSEGDKTSPPGKEGKKIEKEPKIAKAK